MFLKPDAVGIILRAGYRIGDRQSIEGLQWLACGTDSQNYSCR